MKKSEADWEAEYDRLREWLWDGTDIQEIVKRFDLINLHLPEKIGEWNYSVPAKWRGEVSYVSSCAFLDGENETRELIEILAVDRSGCALVCKTRYSSYLDIEDTHFSVMSIVEAAGMRKRYALSRAERTTRVW